LGDLHEPGASDLDVMTADVEAISRHDRDPESREGHDGRGKCILIHTPE
jgi:hypothetical protein